MYVTPFVAVPQFLDFLFCIFQSQFSLLFDFEDFTDMSSSSEILSSAVSSLLISPSKAFFISLWVLFVCLFFAFWYTLSFFLGSWTQCPR